MNRSQSQLRQTTEVVEGKPEVVGVRVWEQNVCEVPREEITNIIVPGQERIQVVDDDRHHCHIRDKVRLGRPLAEPTPREWGQVHPVTEIHYRNKTIIREVEQIIEVPREVEEVIYVDQPIYKVREIPQYIPVVVSRRTVPRESDKLTKVVEDVTWIPEVVYDATKDPRWVTERRRRISKGQCQQIPNPN